MQRLVGVLLFVAGCYGDVGPRLSVTPNHASLFGQVDVTVSGDLAALGTVNYFSVAGIQVINARWQGDSVTVTLQGAPRPGRYDIVVQGSRGRAITHDVFTYDPPPSPVPLSWMAFGASYTQGTESGGIDPHTQVHGVSGVIARAAGVYLGLPLFNPQLTPPAQPSDYYPDCTQKPGTADFGKTLPAILTDPTTGFWDLRYGRLDWTLQNRNVAVGGSTVSDILRGVHGARGVLADVTNAPTEAFNDALGGEPLSMVDRLERADPEVAFSTDLLGNDILPAVLDGYPDPSKVTPADSVAADLEAMMPRLAKLHGQYFVANIPTLEFLPRPRAIRAALVAAGKDTSDFDRRLATINGLAAAYNQALEHAVAPHPNIHIIDFRQFVLEVKGGVAVGDDFVTVDHWGGLISTDDLHLTDTGYALYAQRIVDRINEVLGTHIGAIDLVAVHAADALAPVKTRAAGFLCVPPKR